jgi:guanosine-3',5'-bis(diphosphate) 3'-pyrophosphohydrolase
MTFPNLEKQLHTYLTPEQIIIIREAFAVADKAHSGQTRKSGEPYIQHPLHVAQTLANLQFDPQTIAAALLHDVIEDTEITKEEIEKQFGPEITFLVEGVSKLGKVRAKKDIGLPETNKKDTFHNFPRQFETLRKMFIAMGEDIRVIIIKLADRLHNMQTLNFVDSQKQLRIAQETLEIYAPIAHRLGIGELKGQLEDLAFPYVHPKEYLELKKTVGIYYQKRTTYIKKVKESLQTELETNHIKAEINGRAKHLYSLHQKMLRHNNDLSQIYDLVALRIIVDNVSDCYAVLGIIHKLWKPLNGRIKDYIAMPKPNGYQSLHTTVFCIDGEITEIQIRTREMHEQAEHGVAAHWSYKSNNKAPEVTSKEFQWVKQLIDWQAETTNPEEAAKELRTDFLQKRIFIFTPKGDVHNLPIGATPVDFAYAVHSEIGHHCAGAKVNGKMVTINHPLQNGDVIEIITSKKAAPKTDWLKFVKTSSARSSIRQYLHIPAFPHRGVRARLLQPFIRKRKKQNY